MNLPSFSAVEAASVTTTGLGALPLAMAVFTTAVAGTVELPRTTTAVETIGASPRVTEAARCSTPGIGGVSSSVNFDPVAAGSLGSAVCAAVLFNTSSLLILTMFLGVLVSLPVLTLDDAVTEFTLSVLRLCVFGLGIRVADHGRSHGGVSTSDHVCGALIAGRTTVMVRT